MGFFFGALIAAHYGVKRGISKNEIYDFFTWLIPGVVVGARIGHIIPRWDFYGQNLSQIFAVWNGGLAFHGGLLGALIVGWYYCKKKNIHFLDMADILALPLAIGLALGRLGNYINGELYGKITNIPWGVHFDGVEGLRHPSQIYESLKNLFIFFVVLRVYKLKKFRKGFVFWLFIFMYSFLRFFVEFLKDVEIYFGLTYGQWVSLPLGIMAIYMLNRLK